MPNYSMTDLKKIREETGARIIDCKKALEESDGDMAKAKEFIAEKYLSRAEKKQDRQTGQGYVASYVHNNGKIGALVQVQCETDFVARNEEFRTMVRDLAMQVTAMNPGNVVELLEQDFIKDSNITIETYVKSVSGKIGEKMVVAKIVRFEVGVE
ncbi:MAG: translation elongation factor Ts [Patescibacteria group bacterium]|nr:translation elongation factor Ts [Patescibacteria group bacterium]